MSYPCHVTGFLVLICPPRTSLPSEVVNMVYLRSTLFATASSLYTLSNAATITTTNLQTINGIGASGAWWVNDIAKFPSSVQQNVSNLLLNQNTGMSRSRRHSQSSLNPGPRPWSDRSRGDSDCADGHEISFQGPYSYCELDNLILSAARACPAAISLLFIIRLFLYWSQ